MFPNNQCARRAIVCFRPIAVVVGLSGKHESLDTGGLVWDQADGAFGSAAVPRPAGSSFMPLRRTHRRPGPAKSLDRRAPKPPARARGWGSGLALRYGKTRPDPHGRASRLHAWSSVGKSGPRQPEHRRPSVVAGAARRGRFLGRRGAQPEGRCAQRTSSSFWPRLSERRERSERSEFCGPTLGRAPQGSRRVQRPTAPV